MTAPGARSKGTRPEGPDPHPALRTRLCDLAGVRYPIVQTGMGWVAGARLVAATANAGALGILASATMTTEQLETAIAEVRTRTDSPFGVNMRPDATDIETRVDLLVDGGVQVASFAGAPGPETVSRLRRAGIVVVPTVGARRHAEKMVSWGVDAVVAQGAEGGGHTGQVPTSILVPQVVDAVGAGVAVIGAGGFNDGRGLVAALAWGAEGVAMGTRFLLTQESTVPDDVKKIYLGTSVTGTVVTSRVDGAPQRVVRTEVIDHLEGAGRIAALPRALRNALAFRRETHMSLGALAHEGLAMKKGNGLSWAQVVMAANAPMMTKAALVEGRTDVGILPTGQVVGVIEELPTVAELVARMITEANETLARFGRS
ncbi:MAG TPA: nitronate monooxygenase family protein [Acidimicrobiales bacterium]|nr:nitronate monooxygenase family protein [Acidimicrobiales bacterium]